MRKFTTLLFILSALGLTAQNDWENEQVVDINKEPVHATFFPLNSVDEALGNGVGLNVSGNIPLETSVHHYSAQALSDAVHTIELKKENVTYWNIDYRQGGLEGNSCGLLSLEKYLLKPIPVEFSLIFEPVK